ncbi:hypothetical protein Tco_0837380 [Tanacetum coccineum]
MLSEHQDIIWSLAVLSGGKNSARKRVVRSSQVEMDLTGRRSSQLIAWSQRVKQNRRKWVDISPWNAHPFCTNRMVSDRKGDTLAPLGSSMAFW